MLGRLADHAARRPSVTILVVLVLVGGGLRAWQAAQPRLENASADERMYAALARTLDEHGHYGDRTLGPRHPFHVAPGAPLAFAVAHRVTPPPQAEPTDIPAAYGLLALAGTLLIPATFALGRALGGDVAGLVAAGVVAVYPPLIRMSGELLSEPLGVLALTLAMLALVSRRHALGGALLGVTALIRPDLLIVLLVAPLVILGFTRAVRSAASVLAAGVLVIAPWVLFASTQTGYFVPVAESGSATLLIGTYLPGDGTNNGFKRALADETRARLPRLEGTSDLELPGIAVIDTVRARRPELSRRAALRAETRANLRRYALGRPVAFAGMMGRKIARMWHRPSQTRSPVLDLLHRIGLVLALAGLVAGIAVTRSRDLVLIASAIVASTLVHAVLVAHPRYALPLIPLLVAGGVSGAVVIRKG
jgi:hypothetical protein